MTGLDVDRGPIPATRERALDVERTLRRILAEAGIKLPSLRISRNNFNPTGEAYEIELGRCNLETAPRLAGAVRK